MDNIILILFAIVGISFTAGITIDFIQYMNNKNLKHNSMTIEEKIKKIAEGLGLAYEFNDWSRINVNLDMSNLPVCVNVLPVSGLLKNKNGFVRDNPNCLIGFLDKAEFDFESAENEVTVERMKMYAIRFIKAVNESGFFETVPEDIPYSAVYDKLDVNVTGILLDITLKELRGVCLKDL